MGSSNKSPQFLPHTIALLSSLTTIQTIRTEFEPHYQSSLISTTFFTLDFIKTKQNHTDRFICSKTFKINSKEYLQRSHDNEKGEHTKENSLHC